jgi:hypothetical protein
MLWVDQQNQKNVLCRVDSNILVLASALLENVFYDPTQKFQKKEKLTLDLKYYKECLKHTCGSAPP